MSDLIEFLRARYDEDERVARHAVDGPWEDPLGGPIRGGYEMRFVIAQQVQRWNSTHIVRHDPQRVLAEVDAKRRILDEFVTSLTGKDKEFDETFGLTDWEFESTADPLLRLLALPYADHPDYRDDWRP
ncbi:DUF6221 family protein [Streptomyces fradiae]|uniref:DUF6221 family protein n=1 Tax=Streptomyces fradiae TaxID=1906 RepID=UPI0034119294